MGRHWLSFKTLNCAEEQRTGFLIGFLRFKQTWLPSWACLPGFVLPCGRLQKTVGRTSVPQRWPADHPHQDYSKASLKGRLLGLTWLQSPGLSRGSEFLVTPHCERILRRSGHKGHRGLAAVWPPPSPAAGAITRLPRGHLSSPVQFQGQGLHWTYPPLFVCHLYCLSSSAIFSFFISWHS